MGHAKKLTILIGGSLPPPQNLLDDIFASDKLPKCFSFNRGIVSLKRKEDIFELVEISIWHEILSLKEK